MVNYSSSVKLNTDIIKHQLCFFVKLKKYEVTIVIFLYHFLALVGMTSDANCQEKTKSTNKIFAM